MQIVHVQGAQLNPSLVRLVRYFSHTSASTGQLRKEKWMVRSARPVVDSMRDLAVPLRVTGLPPTYRRFRLVNEPASLNNSTSEIGCRMFMASDVVFGKASILRSCSTSIFLSSTGKRLHASRHFRQTRRHSSSPWSTRCSNTSTKKRSSSSRYVRLSEVV